MCTVSFIPFKQKVLITSNRDEKIGRASAIAPQVYPLKSGNVLFPRDSAAGGTWFGLHENGNTIVFLNGAFKKHEPKPPYRKSRGVLLLELIDQDSPVAHFALLDLKNIEPFTAIIFEEDNLFECRWDGVEKYQQQLNEKIPNIWSSVTLYDEAVHCRRKQWFDAWLRDNPVPTQNDALHFHQHTGDGDAQNDLLMNRNDTVLTVSITAVEISETRGCMKYIDLKNRQGHTHHLTFTKAILHR